MRLGNGNKDIELLVDGEKAFSRIIERIRNATESIYINMFIWRDDRIGNLILQEIIDAADRGVEICVVKDKLGEVFEKSEENKQSLFHKELNFGLWLKAVAIDIMYPMSGKSKSRKQRANSLLQKLFNYRNVNVSNETILEDHSKYYTFDNKILIMGGMNIEDKTIYTDVEGKKYNDYMVEMVSSDYVEKFIQRLNIGTSFNVNSPVEFIFNARRNNEIIYDAKSKILQILSSAKESIDIIMAYMGDKEITEKIIEIANRDEDFSEVLEQSIRRNINDATRISDGSSIKFNHIRAILEQIV